MTSRACASQQRAFIGQTADMGGAYKRGAYTSSHVKSAQLYRSVRLFCEQSLYTLNTFVCIVFNNFYLKLLCCQ